jgi:hypothetical protein
MSAVWTSLLSGVVGAIVGGAASLAGTMVVNKRQMATNARMRLYDELLPELERAIDDRTGATEERVPEVLAAVRRASAIAGRLERRDARNLWQLWGEHQAKLEAETEAERRAWEERTRTLPVSVHADPDPAPWAERPPSAYELRLRRIREEIRAFSDKLGAKLG